MNPPNINAPVRNCCRGSSRSSTPKTSETKKENTTRRSKWLVTDDSEGLRPRTALCFSRHGEGRRTPPSLAPQRDVVGVEDHEKVEQTRNDQKTVAVLVRHRRHHSA